MGGGGGTPPPGQFVAHPTGYPWRVARLQSPLPFHRLLALRPYVRLGVEGLRTACELAVCLSYRLAHCWWQRLTKMRCSLMNFWRMVQRAGERLVRRERDEVGEVRPEDPPPRAMRRVYLEADGVWLRRQRARRRAASGPSAAQAEPENRYDFLRRGADAKSPLDEAP